MSRWDWRVIAVAFPGAVLVTGLAVALMLAPVGRNPIWPDHHLTPSEAVAAEDDAELERLIENGADLNAAYDVRPGLLSDRAARLTPLETAIASHRPDVVDRLLQRGVVVDALGWNHLTCLTDSERISASLERYRPAGAVRNCEAVTAP